jgi:hypothetical protein
LLVLPYTILPEGLNCLFVSPYMKMLRHYLGVQREVRVKSGCKQGFVWVRGRVRSWRRMVQVVVSTKTTRIGAAALQSWAVGKTNVL